LVVWRKIRRLPCRAQKLATGAQRLERISLQITTGNHNLMVDLACTNMGLGDKAAAFGSVGAGDDRDPDPRKTW